MFFRQKHLLNGMNVIRVSQRNHRNITYALIYEYVILCPQPRSFMLELHT